MLTNLLLVSRNVVSKAPFTVAFSSCLSKDALRDDVLPKKREKRKLFTQTDLCETGERERAARCN